MIYDNIYTTGNNYLDEALENYLMYGFKPGGFLTSVLANDLSLALARADYWNKSNIGTIVNVVSQSVPAQAQGSYQAVNDWCADKNGYRSRWAEYTREQRIIRKLENSY